MKLFITTDLHYCERNSIVHRMGHTYTTRLENCIKTQNWTEQEAERLNCDAIVHLGDFFDRPSLTDQEITACKEIEWSKLPHYFLVGNHESGDINLQYSSTKILEDKNRQVISAPMKIDLPECEICFIPYISECERRPINEYFGEKTDKPRIVLSHNDIKGIQMGPVISRLGFDTEEIEQSCDLFLNGHLHNGTVLSNIIINLGNITGKDFGEDATRYEHRAAIIDTNEFTLSFVENPHAFNFYSKIDIMNRDQFDFLDTLKPNAVLSVKCLDELIPELRERIDALPNILEYRIIAFRPVIEDNAENKEVITHSSLDHLALFAEFCRTHLENDDVLEFELGEVCK